MQHEAVTNHRGVVIRRTTDKRAAKAEVLYQMRMFAGKKGFLMLPKRASVNEDRNRCGKPMRAQRSAE